MSNENHIFYHISIPHFRLCISIFAVLNTDIAKTVMDVKEYAQAKRSLLLFKYCVGLHFFL